MQGKFIYVFNTQARDHLLSLGYQMLKSDGAQNLYVFENKEALTFAENTKDFVFALSDTLTF